MRMQPRRDPPCPSVALAQSRQSEQEKEPALKQETLQPMIPPIRE